LCSQIANRTIDNAHAPLPPPPSDTVPIVSDANRASEPAATSSSPAPGDVDNAASRKRSQPDDQNNEVTTDNAGIEELDDACIQAIMFDAAAAARAMLAKHAPLVSEFDPDVLAPLTNRPGETIAAMAGKLLRLQVNTTPRSLDMRVALRSTRLAIPLLAEQDDAKITELRRIARDAYRTASGVTSERAKAVKRLRDEKAAEIEAEVKARERADDDAVLMSVCRAMPWWTAATKPLVANLHRAIDDIMPSRKRPRPNAAEARTMLIEHGRRAAMLAQSAGMQR